MKKYSRVVWQGLTIVGVCLLQFSFPCKVQAEDIDYPALVRAISAVESGGNPRAVGKAGERGLMQIKRDTWREMTEKEFGERIPFSRAFEPELNQQVGQAYLTHLAEQLAGNKDKLNDTFLPVLVAAYHCGPNCVESAGYSTRHLSAQVREYVQRVLNLHGLYASQSRMLALNIHTITLVPTNALAMASPN